MSRLLRASTLTGRPVVTLSGESPLEIRDVVFDTSEGRVLGFTLRKHGFLGSPVSETLTWSDVHGLGPDAVVIMDTSALTVTDDAVSSGGDVIANTVLTESGTELGTVVEVIIETGDRADVVGFEIEAVQGLGPGDDHHVFIPLPDTIAISGDNIIVPDSARDFVRDDLSGFGAAVSDFRSQLGEDA